uniref:Uncharacterized protein n=1 Tax=Ceratitis capitata TaxID=7213 RepID=W8C9J0_CERCA
MVNELNKPPSQENLALGERLLNSQRQLQEMQEEHRQLLQEMEVLRQRAATLSRLNEQQFGHIGHHQNLSETPRHDSNEETANHFAEATEHGVVDAVEQEITPNDVPEQTININTLDAEATTPTTQTHITANDNADDEDPETAEYLQKKLAEIAKLKARFKHVQNIMNTTNMIENHITSKSNNIETTKTLESSLNKLMLSDGLSEEVQSPCVTSTTAIQSNAEPNTNDNQNDPAKYENTTITDDPETLSSYAPPQVANEELLSAMMNMFTDFTADLRSQADDLRAERDRLRALKEDLLRRKRQS